MEEARNRGRREDVGTSRRNKVLLHRLKNGTGPSVREGGKEEWGGGWKTEGPGRKKEERGRGIGSGGLEGLHVDHKSSVNTHDSF